MQLQQFPYFNAVSEMASSDREKYSSTISSSFMASPFSSSIESCFHLYTPIFQEKVAFCYILILGSNLFQLLYIMLLPNDFLKREKALLFPLFFQIFYLSIISVLIISSIEFRILFIFYIQSGGLVALIRSATLCLQAYSFTSRENIFSCLFVNIGEVTVRLTDSQQVVYRIR